MGAAIAAAHGGEDILAAGGASVSVKEDAMNRFIRALAGRFLAAWCSVALPHEVTTSGVAEQGP